MPKQAPTIELPEVVPAASYYAFDKTLQSTTGIGFKSISKSAPEPDTKALRSILFAGLFDDEIEAMRAVCKANDVDPDAPDRMIPWVISTPQRDRDGDRIESKGADLKEYFENPIVLYNHARSGLPTATAIKTWKRPDFVKSIALFPVRDVADGFPYSIYQLAKAMILRASSIGFMPIKFEKDSEMTDEEKAAFPWGGYLHSKWRLLEWSPVTIPSNPGALQAAKALGADVVGPYLKALSKALDNESDPMSIAMRRFGSTPHIAQCWAHLSERKSFTMPKNHTPSTDPNVDMDREEKGAPTPPERDDFGDERKPTEEEKGAPAPNDDLEKHGRQITAGGLLVAAARVCEQAEESLAQLKIASAQINKDQKRALSVLYRAQDLLAETIAKIEGDDDEKSDDGDDDKAGEPGDDAPTDVGSGDVIFELADD